jgi:long-chain acyl-CoA synthetase
MPNETVKEPTTAYGVMESGGAYNLHAKVQAEGGSQALPFLEQAVRNLALDGGRHPIVIADYGSSQGKNSLLPMRTAIRALRARVGPDRPITVTHVDQATNDFNTLFDVLHSDPDRYALDDPNVFPSAIGRSFYEQVFPPNDVDLAWSSYAAAWLSRIPTRISGHFRAARGTDTERTAFHRQAAQDWETFLALRATELRRGGRLVVILPGLDDEGVSGLEDLMDLANSVLADMVGEGAIRAEERARMALGSCPRRRRDLLAPFDSEGRFAGLIVESCELSSLAEPAWAQYTRDGNKEELATKRARLFRATFAPSLASALTAAGNGAGRAFADRLEKGLQRRLANHQAPAHTFVQTMVLSKQEYASAMIPQRAAASGTGHKHAAGITLGELLHSRSLQNPNATALFCNDRKMNYGELDESSTRLAHWLIDQGLQPGDRVAIHWSNSIEVAQIFFAVFKAALIAVPINLRLKSPEVVWILEHSQAAMCFSEPALTLVMKQARTGCASLRRVLTELPELAAAEAHSLPDVQDDQPAAILYTSGSTARPKGATHTHRTLREAARLMTEDLLDAEDIVLTMTPMMHALGLGCALLPAIGLGIPAVLLSTFEPGAVLDAIEHFRCTYTIGLPAFMQLVAGEQARKPRDLSSLRTAAAGGDCVPVKLQERFAALFGVPLYEGIGMTETFPIAFNPKLANRPGSLGVPRPGVELRIVDTDDRNLQDGETGEIVVRSPANCLGYWNDPGATDALLRNGWLRTGDLGTRDSDGYLWFKGRKKEIIIRGGSNVSPQEIEEVLYQHPGIFEAGVIGAPDPIYGQRIVAFVSLRNGAAPGEQELREFARRSLADYKVPERIIFVPVLPKSATGKVHRSSLKAWLRENSI